MNNTLFYYYYNDNTKLKYPIIEKENGNKRQQEADALPSGECRVHSLI